MYGLEAIFFVKIKNVKMYIDVYLVRMHMLMSES